jgi:hypothetical protein
MDLELTLLAVPVLAVLVLGAMLATAGRTFRSLCLNTLGVIGVLFGGPGAVYVLGAPPAADGSSDVGKTIEIATDSKAASPAGDARPDDAATTESTPSPSAATPGSSGSGSPAELHEPIASGGVSFPEGRPSWVFTSRVREGRNVDTQVVASGPYSRVQDCSDALDEELRKAVDDYIDWHLDHDGAATFVNIDLRYINTHLVKQRAQYPIQSSVGLMQQSDALLEFDQAFRDKVNHHWDEARATSRLLLAGLFGGGAIGLLGLLFGFFKLDNATRGFYTGRLQFATVAGILGLVAAGVLLARWIPWL